MIEKDRGNLSLTGQCVPVLPMGEYEICAQLRVTFPETEEDSLKDAKRFSVQGQRFALTQEQIISVYPAPGELFGRIAPAADELAYLVHGRKSDPKLKAQKLSALSAEEVQSVVFCNRTPRCGTLEALFLTMSA